MFNLITRLITACVAVTVCMVRGPLLQQASIVTTRDRVLSGMTTVDRAHELPATFFTYANISWLSSNWFQADVAAVIQQAAARTPITMNHTGCDGECETTVKVFSYHS